jgi:hypothetical protein
MNKSEAIALIHRRRGASQISTSSVHFANINSRKLVWWRDIPISAISQPSNPTINLLLYDHRSRELHYLEIPKTYFRDNERRLVTRHDKGCISLELSTEKDKTFRDIRPTDSGVEFKQFLKESVT